MVIQAASWRRGPRGGLCSGFSLVVLEVGLGEHPSFGGKRATMIQVLRVVTCTG